MLLVSLRINHHLAIYTHGTANVFTEYHLGFATSAAGLHVLVAHARTGTYGIGNSIEISNLNFAAAAFWFQHFSFIHTPKDYFSSV
jgi:hypothetical protein